MRRLVYFTLGFAGACVAGSYFYGRWILAGCAAAFLFAGVLLSLRRDEKSLRRVGTALLGLAVGLGWFSLFDEVYVGTARGLDGETVSVQITATDFSYDTDYGSAVEGTVRLNDRNYLVKAYLNEKVDLEPGDQINGTFRFRLTTDGGAEDPTSHRSDGIFLLAYPKSDTSIVKATQSALIYYPAQWRQKLLEGIRIVFPRSTAGFAAALLLGDRTDIDYELNTAFKVSGISHVIAVSGLHVSILFGLLYTLTGKKRLLSGLVGIPVLVLFAAVVGFTPSVTRACIMQSLVLVASMTNREYDPPTALAFAVLAMLFVNPLTIVSVSFQLSVGCLIGIFLFSEKIRAYLAAPGRLNIGKGKDIRTRLKRWFARSVSVTLSATVVTTPLVAYYFGCVSLVGVVCNLLVLWVISFIFYGILLCLGLCAVSANVAAVAAKLVSLPILFVTETAKLLSKLPMAAVYTASPYVIVWLVGVYVLLAIFLLQKKKQPKLLLVCAVSTLLLAQILAWAEPLTDDVRMTVLDVGQGQCILLQSEGKNYMVDCGGDDGEEAADLAAETLLSQGISRLDGIILTHYDTDHSGGLEYLLTRIHCDQLFLPNIADTDGVGKLLEKQLPGAVQYINEDTTLTFGACTMTIIGPYSYHSGNESGLCILFQREECDILITGDRGEMGELMLLLEHQLPQLDVLVAGHHGSNTSTGEELLAVTMPKLAIISVGEDNHYGHPSDAVLKRLEAIGCQIRRTDLNGTVVYRG